MIGFGCGDQLRVDVDTDHVMPEHSEATANSSRSTAGIQNPSNPPSHRVDEPRLTVEIMTLRRHRPETFDVPRRMIWILLDRLKPSVAAHAETVPIRRPR